jgi:signal-transduction protein with cAMP-binding, CBS, and nucleotidyltransferase domain
MQKVKFFQERDIKANDFPDIVQSLTLEHFHHGEVVFNWGDYGDKFYIILRGQVNVLIPSPNIKNSRDEMQYLIDDLNMLENRKKHIESLILLKLTK